MKEKTKRWCLTRIHLNGNNGITRHRGYNSNLRRGLSRLCEHFEWHVDWRKVICNAVQIGRAHV